jgi:hypothetical protein
MLLVNINVIVSALIFKPVRDAAVQTHNKLSSEHNICLVVCSLQCIVYSV